MARNIRVKLIMELRGQGMSQREIACTRKMSRTSISEVCSIAKERQITYDEIKDLDDAQVYELFFPHKTKPQSAFSEPDYAYVHKEYDRKGVTLSLLHQEYCDRCSHEGTLACGSTKFNEGYRHYCISGNLTRNYSHKAGECAEVDWAGTTFKTILATGEALKVYFFVGVLPYSQYAFVEATQDMTERTWLRCNVHMLEYFGGVPLRITCDNLKTAVISHPRAGEIILNDAYEALGCFYGLAITPAQVRKPKQKASAEGTVRDITTHIIAKMRNTTFLSFDDIKTEVKRLLEQYNARPFQKRSGSRKSVFDEIEATELRSLPHTRYDVCEWVYNRSVALNCHISYRKNYYSVPACHVGRKVDLRVGESTLEIYHSHERIASHKLFAPYITNHYCTCESHMPDKFAKQKFDDVRIRSWAKQIGPNCVAVIERIFLSVDIKEQAYNPALSVLRLSKDYGKERLESACEYALTKFNSPRYRHLRPLMQANIDKLEQELSVPSDNLPDPTPHGGYIRGSKYYC